MQAQDPIVMPAINGPAPITQTTGPRAPLARKAAGIVLLAYLAVWAAVVAMLVSKPASFGEFGDPRLFGVILVSATLGAALLASLVWVASRRLFAIIVGALLVVNGIPLLAYNQAAALLPGAAGIVLLYFAIRRRRSSPTPASAAAPAAAGASSMLVLIGLPIVILLILGSFWLDQALQYTIQ
jgi:hypothetical protein